MSLHDFGSWRDQLAGIAIIQRCIVAEAMTLSAQARCESRGSHFRSDFPDTLPIQPYHNVVRLSEGFDLESVPGGTLADMVRERLSGSSLYDGSTAPADALQP